MVPQPGTNPPKAAQVRRLQQGRDRTLHVNDHVAGRLMHARESSDSNDKYIENKQIKHLTIPVSTKEIIIKLMI